MHPRSHPSAHECLDGLNFQLPFLIDTATARRYSVRNSPLLFPHSLRYRTACMHVHEIIPGCHPRTIVEPAIGDGCGDGRYRSFFSLSFFSAGEKEVKGDVRGSRMSNRVSQTTAMEETATATSHSMADLIRGKIGVGRRRQRSRATLTYALLLMVCATLTVSHCCYVFPKGIPEYTRPKRSSLSSPPILVIDIRLSPGNS